MSIFLFQSAADTEVFGFTFDASGKTLPAEFSPWCRATDGGGLPVGAGGWIADIAATRPVIRAAKRDGFYIARSGVTITRTNYPA